MNIVKEMKALMKNQMEAQKITEAIHHKINMTVEKTRHTEAQIKIVAEYNAKLEAFLLKYIGASPSKTPSASGIAEEEEQSDADFFLAFENAEEIVIKGIDRCDKSSTISKMLRQLEEEKQSQEEDAD